MNQHAFRLLAAILIILTVPLTAAAEIGLYLVDGTGDAQKVEIAPGGTFTVQAGLGTTQALVGLSYWLNISDNGSDRFYLIQRVIDPGSPFPDLITGNAAVIEATAALLDPYNDRDLGALTDNPLIPAPPGVYPLATYTIGAASDVPLGTYTLSAIGGVGADTKFNEFPITAHAYTVVITDSPDSGEDDSETDPGNSDEDEDANDDGSDDPGQPDEDDETDTDEPVDDEDDPDEPTDNHTGGGGDTSGPDDSSDGNGQEPGIDNQDGTGQDDTGSGSAGGETEGTAGRSGLPGCGAGGAGALGAMACLWLFRPGGRPRRR